MISGNALRPFKTYIIEPAAKMGKYGQKGLAYDDEYLIFRSSREKSMKFNIFFKGERIIFLSVFRGADIGFQILNILLFDIIVYKVDN
jgi:hypothetical protein